MLKNRKNAVKKVPDLKAPNGSDASAAGVAAYQAAWKAKMGKVVTQEEVDQLAERYGLPPEALNLKKTDKGYVLSDEQILSDESLARLADGLTAFYRDLTSVRIQVPDVVVANAEEAANAVPNEVYDPVSDTFIEGRIVIDADKAKTFREEAGMQEPDVSPEEIEEARQRRVEQRKVPSGKQKAADTDYPSAAAKAEAERIYRENSQTGRGTRFSIGGTDKAQEKLNSWHSMTSRESVRNAIASFIDKSVDNGDIRKLADAEKLSMSIAANAFYDEYANKVIEMSDGRCVYFAPDERNLERGMSNDECWAIYCVHAVTHGGKTIPGKGYAERVWSPNKVRNITKIEDVIKEEKCFPRLDRDPSRDRIVFTGKDADGERMDVVTKLDEYGNVDADLTEITAVMVGGKTPPTNVGPLTEVVKQVAIHQADGYSLLTQDIIPNNGGSGQVGTTHFSLVLGEQGAANLDDNVKVLENLQVAKRMLGDLKWVDGWTQDEGDRISAWKEKSHDEQLKIKLATGWEVGVDGKWRYEAADINRGLISDGDQEVKTEHNDLLKKRNEIVMEMNDLVKQMNVIWDRIKKEHPKEAASFFGITPIANEDPEYSKLKSAHKDLDSEYKKIARKIGALKRSNTKTKLGGIKTSGYLGPFIDGQPVGKAYPQLFDVKLQFKSYKGKSYGYYDKWNRTIVINARNNPDIMENTLVHEIQRAIQHIEGWTGGADPDSVGWDAYERNAGEVEARNAGRRTTDDIKKLLEDTEDVSRDVQIVRGEVGDALAKIEDASGDIRFSLNGGEDYVKMFGKVLSGDSVRSTLPGFNPTDYKTHIDHSGYVGGVMQKTFDYLLSSTKGSGNGSVVILAGGNGSGKSTASAGSEYADFVIDSTLGNIDLARSQIKAVIDNGQTPHIVFVYRDPVESLGGIETRVKRGGHIVSPRSFVDSHTKPRENLPLLMDEFGDKMSVSIFKNTPQGTSKITLDELNGLPKVDYEQLRKQANEYLQGVRDQAERERDFEGPQRGGGKVTAFSIASAMPEGYAGSDAQGRTNLTVYCSRAQLFRAVVHGGKLEGRSKDRNSRSRLRNRGHASRRPEVEAVIPGFDLAGEELKFH